MIIKLSVVRETSCGFSREERRRQRRRLVEQTRFYI